jgi:hypothetical protein
MKNNITGERAWATLGLAVAAYEVTAAPNQLLSEAVDRFLIRHPVITRAVIGVTAAHLLNLLPNAVDPIHHLALFFRRTVEPADQAIRDPRPSHETR